MMFIDSDGGSSIAELTAEFEAEQKSDEYLTIGDHHVRRERRIWDIEYVCTDFQMRRAARPDFRTEPCKRAKDRGDRQ